MQIQTDSRDNRHATEVYRERLAPSLKIIAGAAIVAPMVSLVFVQVDRTLALSLGALSAIALVSALIWAAPVIRVSGGELRAGRAHIDVSLLGDPRSFDGDDARAARGPGLDGRGWHLIRGGIAGIVSVPNIDPDDPVRSWTISTRTPDRLAAAIRRAQRES
ncbi:DUF3093 domain-containing protein [Microbacterium sp. G2-8]|uniref:DUF3093 domain-containing protein n=1 Tax=Microbacterium sp. G2-8 TaxID=2842454 RepID=UPI001C8A5B84|nr:DUF3093 domain-containing protein [Microbacterium sp. G2-8]